MNLLEYEGKALFRNHHIPVPLGIVVTSLHEAEHIARKVGVGRWF